MHVFLNGKIIQIHYKNNGLNGFTGCVRKRKRYQKHIKNTSTHIKIDENNAKNMLEKVMQQIQKIIKRGAKKGAKKTSKNLSKIDSKTNIGKLNILVRRIHGASMAGR